jgi:hypothetical protein
MVTDSSSNVMRSLIQPRTALAALLIPISCAMTEPMEGAQDNSAESNTAHAVHALTSPFPIDPRKSLSVTDTDVVSEFTLEEVLEQLVDQANVPGLTPTAVFQQMFDTYRKSSEGLNPSLGPHCDDVLSSTPPPAEDDGIDEPFDGSINGWLPGRFVPGILGRASRGGPVPGIFIRASLAGDDLLPVRARGVGVRR